MISDVNVRSDICKARPTIVRHGENGNLGDRAIAAFHSAGTFVQSRQIRVEVTGVTSSARDFFSGSRHFSQGVGITEISASERRVKPAHLDISVMTTNTCFSSW